MKTKFYSITAIMVVALTLAACGGLASAQGNLDGTRWILLTYRETKPIGSVRPTLNFEKDQVSGNASCNNYGGSYQVDGEKITFGPMFMTEMYCVALEGIMDQESLYLKMMGSVERFELNEGLLVLFLSDGGTLVFVPAE